MNTTRDGISQALTSISSKGNGHRLPERVLAIVRQNEELSEVLVRIIQLFVVVAMSIVFLLSPKGDTQLASQVPLVLGCYFVFTLVALGFAARRQLPQWVLFVSIIVDMALLTYLIFSFHIQYEQPASFSLKSPSFMLYFVLIAIRALRFDFRHVLAAGVASILSWIILVLIVTQIDPYDSMITRDYVTYLTSNTVLIGAEVDKMLSLGMFTTILALGVYRANSFFVTAIAEAQAASSLARFMPGDIAHQIRDADKEIKAGEGKRLNLSIMNIDIRGFSNRVATMEPQEAMALLSDYQERLVPIVHNHGGVVDKFMGDGIMAVFGLEEREDRAALDAMQCARDIFLGKDAWKGPSKDVKINLAIATGPVVHGAVGSGDRLEFTVIGATVNRSAKYEKHNKAVDTNALCDVPTLEAAIAQGYRDPGHAVLKNQAISGIDEAVSLVVIA
ncbi:adenylate/guanylate cyclase domain-containing protein [Pseudahrensia aquimaris]|uniref:Adenylate/guanylate cyclase domain-containing protein n=1 Tax=Pseudahrensia aquimaris TaxID=744461 RepID=A0ABW3FFT1_9HYPH